MYFLAEYNLLQTIPIFLQLLNLQWLLNIYLTLSEKISMLMGNPKLAEKAGYVGWTSGVPRLGVPPLRMNDGPQGFRAPKRAPGTSTQWPSGLTMAHTWNRSTMHAWGQALGLEFHNKGANVFFGPGLNVQRIANGGRSFEYLSGEDPSPLPLPQRPATHKSDADSCVPQPRLSIFTSNMIQTSHPVSR